MKTVIFSSLLFILTAISVATTMEAPAIEWEVIYGTFFHDVQETAEGNYIVAGRKWQSEFKKSVFFILLLVD